MISEPLQDYDGHHTLSTIRIGTLPVTSSVVERHLSLRHSRSRWRHTNTTITLDQSCLMTLLRVGNGTVSCFLLNRIVKGCRATATFVKATDPRLQFRQKRVRGRNAPRSTIDVYNRGNAWIMSPLESLHAHVDNATRKLTCVD